MKKMCVALLLGMGVLVLGEKSVLAEEKTPEIPKGVVVRKAKGEIFQEWIFKYLELSKTSVKIQFQDEWYGEENKTLLTKNSPPCFKRLNVRTN